ncbi:hypothetical protein [Bacillus phage vB_BanS-Thrax3]|nr:hypothetical protein [Bacillus phage vB_BanS-Thrax3]
MIRKDQLEAIDYLVNEYRKDLIQATKLENEANEAKLKKIVEEYVHLYAYLNTPSVEDKYVVNAVAEKADIVKAKLKQEGLGANQIHALYPFGFAKNENKLVEEVMHAQARTGRNVVVKCNPLYFDTYFKGAYKASAIKHSGYIGTIAGVSIKLDENVYSYILNFAEDEE